VLAVTSAIELHATYTLRVALGERGRGGDICPPHHVLQQVAGEGDDRLLLERELTVLSLVTARVPLHVEPSKFSGLLR